MPWSRPGDYVLFQAQKDLVCVSSACPSDIEPANDWNPTDIYVRVYNEKNRFSKSIGYRKNADSDFMLTKETGFHPRTSKLTKDMMEAHLVFGYQINIIIMEHSLNMKLVEKM